MRILGLLVAILGYLHLTQARVGRKTYKIGLSILCKRLLKYINKYLPQLEHNLSSDDYACVTGMVSCLQSLVNHLLETDEA